MQSGGSTAVMNRSLSGVVQEALARREIVEVYGAVRGLGGLLSRGLVKLSRYTPADWRGIGRTPGAVLGSSRRRLVPEDVQPAMDILAEYDVRCLFIIGGNDSAETGRKIDTAARDVGSTLAVINVPKTIDNDLAHTDHSPGYGSAARFVALAAMGAGRDAEAMGVESPITVIEVMGRGRRLASRVGGAGQARRAGRAPRHMRPRGPGGRNAVR